MGRFDAPEFIIYNAEPGMIEWWLNNFAFRVRDAVQKFSGNTVIEGLLDDYDIFLLHVDDSSEHLTLANRFYRVPGQRPVHALQICQPGLNRLWPWRRVATFRNRFWGRRRRIWRLFHACASTIMTLSRTRYTTQAVARSKSQLRRKRRALRKAYTGHGPSGLGPIARH